MRAVVYFSHDLGLDEAVHGYDRFHRRVDGWTTALLQPRDPA
jgi:glutathione-independent formaldehyde dehydrogenase